MRSYSEISYAIINKYSYILATLALVCLSLISEATLLSGNIQKYQSKTAFKILHISVRMTSAVVTALKSRLDFMGNVEEDSLPIFDEILGETFFGMAIKVLSLSRVSLSVTPLACSVKAARPTVDEDNVL